MRKLLTSNLEEKRKKKKTQPLAPQTQKKKSHLPRPRPDPGAQQPRKVPGHQQARPELLGRRLEPRRHVDVGRQVRRVDLVLAADRALDRPADVQAEAHPDAEAGQPLLDVGAGGELSEAG